MVSHKRKYCTNNKSKKLLTIMNTKLDLIQKSLDDLHKEHADASMSTGLSDSSATLDTDSNASMYQSDLNSSTNESPMNESPAPADVSTETEMSTMPSTDLTSEESGTPSTSSTENATTEMSGSSTASPLTEMSGSPSEESGTLSPIVAPAGSETPSWMNESTENYGEAQPQTPPGGYPPLSSEETKTGGKRRIRKSKRQQRQYLRNKSRNRRM